MNILVMSASVPLLKNSDEMDVIIGTILGWLVWIAGAAAVGTIIWIAIQVMVGRRNRSQMAADGLFGLPWVVVGLVMVAVAASFTNFILDKAGF